VQTQNAIYISLDKMVMKPRNRVFSVVVGGRAGGTNGRRPTILTRDKHPRYSPTRMVQNIIDHWNETKNY